MEMAINLIIYTSKIGYSDRVKMSGRKKIFIFLIFLFIFLFTASVVIDTGIQGLREESLSSSYQLNIQIKTEGPLSNVTFYLPAPLQKGRSVIVEDLIASGNYDPGWSLSIEETANGPMLQIMADEILPTFHSAPVALEDNAVGLENAGPDTSDEGIVLESSKYCDETPIPYPKRISFTYHTDRPINTLYPDDNASVLLPKYNMTPSVSQGLVEPPSHIDPQYYVYDSYIYADYETPSNTTVEITVELRGSNEWWVGGWRSNDFRDSVHIQLQGPCNSSWRMVNGSMVTGDGIMEDWLKF